jgi:hypothetical protein
MENGFLVLIMSTVKSEEHDRLALYCLGLGVRNRLFGDERALAKSARTAPYVVAFASYLVGFHSFRRFAELFGLSRTFKEQKGESSECTWR